ncbi:MAG: hypothetical protein EWM73_02563 [Nitrospira sp.]|nr:MAG: hypothetical protein EWM73_02563 [Nitrospira sp.]
MGDRLVHVEPLRRRLFPRDNDVDVVAAAQTVVGDGQERIGVGRQIDPDHLGLLIHHMIDEPRILVAEPVVILPPDVGGQEIIQRGDRSPPWDVAADLQPLGMLVEHRVDDVNERFVAGEEPVTTGQEIAFQPALALMLTEHLHDPAVRREVVVVGIAIRHPRAIGHLQHILPAV